MSRLDIIDAAFHYASRDVSRDQYVLVAFEIENDTSPTTEDVAEFIRLRACKVPELLKTIKEVPGNLEYPYWVLDTSPPDSHIVELPAQSWHEFQIKLGHLVEKPLDATRAAWNLHVACGVEGVPHIDGKAIVAVLQVSHALTDGRGASRLARLLFSSDTAADADADADADAAVQTEAPQERSLVPVAVFAAVALPFRLAVGRIRAVHARRAYARTHRGGPDTRDSPRPGIRGNGDCGTARVIHVLDCAPGTFARSSLSVTTLALTAVSVATERYLASVGESTPSTLNSLVPMALPDDIEWPAVNRIVNGTVDLHTTEADLSERALAIKKSLSAARDGVVDPLLLRWIRAENLVPAPIYLAVNRRRSKHTHNNHDVPDAVLTNVTVVSVSRGRANLELCGATGVFTAGFPMLGPTRSISHGFYGLGDTVTPCIVACPDAFPDHERYAKLLKKAVMDVAEATSAPS